MTFTEQRERRELTQRNAATLEDVLIKGDLKSLTDEQRVSYYNRLCEITGLNPLAQPFAYIVLNGKLTLYALRSATDQLRAVHGVSVTDMDKMTEDGVHIVTVKVQDAKGRTDMATGAVSIGALKGEALANALMKAETKAKRRATLSICGLGLLDETEVETIPTARPLTPANAQTLADDEPPLVVRAPSSAQAKRDGVWEAFMTELNKQTDIDKLERWWKHPATQRDVDAMPGTWPEQAHEEYEKAQERLLNAGRP